VQLQKLAHTYVCMYMRKGVLMMRFTLTYAPPPPLTVLSFALPALPLPLAFVRTQIGKA